MASDMQRDTGCSVFGVRLTEYDWTNCDHEVMGHNDLFSAHMHAVHWPSGSCTFAPSLSVSEDLWDGDGYATIAAAAQATELGFRAALAALVKAAGGTVTWDEVRGGRV